MTQSRRRLLFFTALLSLCFIALEARLFHLQIMKHPSSEKAVLAMHRRTEKERAARGRVRMRNGYVLAESIPAVNIYANANWTRDRAGEVPRQRRDQIARELAATIGEIGVNIRARLNRPGYRRLLKKYAPQVFGLPVKDLRTIPTPRLMAAN